MVRAVLTVGFFVASFAILAPALSTSIRNNINKIAVEVVPVKNIKDFKPKDAMMKLNLKARATGLMNEEEADPTAQGEIITYTIGSRIDGDHLLAQGSNSEEYAALQDVQVELQYPGPDDVSGAIVTYVEMLVNQSSDIGNAYIVEGGVGYRNIKIVLEVGNTSFYRFSANIYGY